MEFASISSIGLIGSFLGLFLGGLVKGVVGGGLPLVSVPVLALIMPVPQALVILTIPMFVTNVWQVFQGGHFVPMARRFWLMSLALAIGIGIGAQILMGLEQQTIYLVMGILVLIQPAVRILSPHAAIPQSTQRYLGPVVSLTSGVVGGLSGFFGPLLFVYLAMIRLPKELFPAAMALLLLIGSIALAFFLARLGMVAQHDLVLSAVAVLPAMIGIQLGQKIRSQINQKQFETALTVTMLVMGLSLLQKVF